MMLRPFLSVWTHPRSTVRAITAENPRFFVLPLAILAGIEQTLQRAYDNPKTASLPLPMVLIVALVIGFLWGPISLWLGSWLLGWTGQWINGHSSREHLRTALAWASVPTLAALLLWIPRFLLFGTDAFSAFPVHGKPSGLLLSLVLNLIDLTLATWNIVLLCNTVAEVQDFRSAWKGLVNLLLAGLVVAVPFAVLVFVLVGLGRH